MKYTDINKAPDHFFRTMWLTIICVVLCLSAKAGGPGDPDPVFYETSIFVVVQGIGGRDIPAVVNNDSAYLSIRDMFNFLKIRNTISVGMDSISGFFITEKAPFFIDAGNRLVQYKGKDFPLKESDIIKTATAVYLRTGCFGTIFGLDCQFSFRSLSIRLVTQQELPAMREKKQETIRRNIGLLKGQQRADTIIRPTHSMFRIGMADWSVISTQRPEGGGNDTWLNLSLGGMLLGGETSVSLNYNNYAQQQWAYVHDSALIKPFDQRRQFYRWRYVNNDNKALRQIIAGKIFVPSIASIFDPIVGIQLTNTPTSYRRSFGSYTISNYTEPGWTVELYVNNALVDYTVADAAGFYTFQVPLVYGNSVVRLRFFGPWGEERFREENISIPFNFLPAHEFEYTASAGVVEDGKNSFFSRVQANYGATRSITVGGGVEYLSSISKDKTMPFVMASARLASNLLLSGEYTHGVRGQGILTYRMPSGLQLELYYTRYKKGQQAIIYNYLEERKIVLSKPFLLRKITMFNRLTYNQIILPDTRYATANWLLSGAVYRIGFNINTYAVFIKPEPAYVYTNLALTWRLPGALLITPQVQYEYNTGSLMAIRGEVGKYVFRHGYINTFYEHNYKSQITNVGLGLRYDFSFTQIGFSAWKGTNMSTLVESARGSLVYDDVTRSVGFSNRVSVGTGGIVLVPFLDVNDNGRRDPGEPKVYGLKINSNGGRILYQSGDSTVRIINLEPYEYYFIGLIKNSFENIAWQIRKPALSVAVDPNQMKLVEVPVSVMAEVSGCLKFEDEAGTKAPGDITIQFFKQDTVQVASVRTEADGSFSYMGLQPGTYIVRPDTIQLHKLGLTAKPAQLPFEVRFKTEGDVVKKLNFRLKKMADQ
ncbi:carboxypeptidase-like regulatory domain-containing protein [Chitinophaga qingshengii]|uniref:Carboxypeptidase regulatory-like domain-containing protein n=1 Tax=Chitinophaga qingshengii TaxID=1569794 RepID=A0ABR7TJB1_9BACT|nr:carboxypeptidase-like regulatory domain-containing protein [Chitinophaga qingshengii]MBC9930576.1 carboxypeptidase regulatory-like domain-containing protein [Chitinophaga qingshengii]